MIYYASMNIQAMLSILDTYTLANKIYICFITPLSYLLQTYYCNYEVGIFKIIS